MLIAVDHGNYSIKTPNFSFVAGLAEHTVPPPILDDCIEYDGRYWTLSESRIFYMRDKTQDDRYFILTLFAIAKELEKKRYTSPVVSVDLAVGLPPEHYGVLKDRFAAYFKRNIIEAIRQYMIANPEIVKSALALGEAFTSSDVPPQEAALPSPPTAVEGSTGSLHFEAP